MKVYFYVIILLISMMSEAKSQTETCLQNLNDPDLRNISQVIGTETITREYILHLPSNYDENIPTPLIINMHGFGDCASGYSQTIGDNYNFSQIAEEENIIVVYPQGAYRPEKGDTYWEPGDNGAQNIYDNDVYFMDELVANLQNEYNINSDMIFACGYSNGGMMAYSLACNRSSLFSAIGIMSGTMLDEECTLEKPVPVIIFHGIADAVLPYHGNIWYQSVEEVVNFWLNQNNIQQNSLNSFQLNDGKVVLNQYTGGESNSCLDLYTINEEYDKPGDHVWFSENIENATPNRIMWNFFRDNCSAISSTDDANRPTLELFPNPVKKHLQIKNVINEAFYIYDINGQMKIEGLIKSNKELINVEGLKPGIYLLSIRNETSKFLKIEE